MATQVHNRKNILKHYDINPDNNDALCKICNRVLSRNRIFNLKKHLVGVHKLNVQQVKREEDTSAAKSTLTSSKLRRQSLKVKMNRKQLYRSYIGLIVEDNMPLQHLDTQNMRTIIDPLSRALGQKFRKNIHLNSNNCRRALRAIAENIRADIKNEFKEQLLSLKISIATRLGSRQRGITAQFIADGEVHSRTLGMSAPEADLATDIFAVLSKYDICSTQIVSITTDVDASGWRALEGEAAEVDNTNAAYLRKIDLFGNMLDERLGDVQISLTVAHMVQLCALDVSKNTNIRNYLLHCRNLTKFVRKPANGYHEIFALKKWQLPQLDCPTRWGSTYQMIADLRSAKEVLCMLDAVTNRTDEENFDVNESFWEFIESYFLAFAPLQKTIVKLQQQELHYSNFYAQWLKCKLCTEKVPINTGDKKSPLLLQIRQNLLQSMENRTALLLSNEGLNACLYLDPRFNHRLSQAQKLAAGNYLQRLWDKMNDLDLSVTKPAAPNCSPTTPPPATASVEDDDDDEMLDEFLTKELGQKIGAIDVYSRIFHLQLPYLRVDTNVLSYWCEKQLSDPELYALSRVCFAVPANLLAFEQTFSTMTTLLADKLNRLDAETLENISLVKLNPQFIEQTIDNTPLFEEDGELE